jgi:glyoxylase-like metal-dependent hydrolase (beta-lactamase superfamily II)
MADLGISHTHADHYGSVRSKKPATANSRRRLHFAINVTLIGAAFAFVAAVVCGVIG